MDLMGGLAAGILLLAAGGRMIWKLHHIGAWFSAGLLLVAAGIFAVTAALSGATMGAALGGAAFVAAIILGMWLWPRGDFS